MPPKRATITGAGLLCLPLVLIGCGDRAQQQIAATKSASPTSGVPSATAAAIPAAYAPAIDAAYFSTTIDNPFLPLLPGTRHIYEGTTDEGKERIVVDVLRETRQVMGVTCVVVRDTVTFEGQVIEDTYDWYAQHRDGSVWYFGEDTKELEDGKVVNTNGAWEAGVDGALPGVVMPAVPRVGDRFRQEYAIGIAEDEFAILSTSATAKLATGSLAGLVQTADTTKLDPSLVEHKFYARDIGFVLVVHVKGPQERIELITSEKF